MGSWCHANRRSETQTTPCAWGVWPIGPHPTSPDRHQGCLPTMPASFSACPHRAQLRSVQTEKGAEFAGGGGNVDLRTGGGSANSTASPGPMKWHPTTSPDGILNLLWCAKDFDALGIPHFIPEIVHVGERSAALFQTRVLPLCKRIPATAHNCSANKL